MLRRDQPDRRGGAGRGFRWTVRIGVALTACLLVALGSLLYMRRGAGSTEVTVGEAVDRFRVDGGASPPSVPPGAGALHQPEQGVYTYATYGSTSTSALGGATHDFPPITSVTVMRSGCGSIARWGPLEERWSESYTCIRGDRELLMSITDHRQFFGHEDTTSYECSDTSPRPSPVAPAPGTVVESTCSSGDDLATIVHTVVGPEVLEIGGTPVETFHTSIDTTVLGPSASGHSQAERWLVYETGLLVRERASSTGTKQVGPFAVSVEENRELALRSLSPTT